MGLTEKEFVVEPYYPDWDRNNLHYRVTRVNLGQVLVLSGGHPNPTAAWSWLDQHRFDKQQ